MKRAAGLFIFHAGVWFTAALSAQTVQSPAAELANLREDVRLLVQRVGELSLRVEQLETENARLARATAGARADAATLSQLNTAVADLSREIKAAQAQTKSEVLAVVATQMENLARQTNAALDAQATRQRAAAPVAAPTFTDNFPKDGITYTVAPGDTLSRIAQKTGAKLADIINANKIVDPTRVQVGQVLFIPGGK